LQKFLRLSKILPRSPANPPHSQILILRNSPAEVEKHPIIELRCGITELRRLGVKLCRLGVIPGNAAPAVVVIAPPFVKHHRIHLLYSVLCEVVDKAAEYILLGDENSKAAEQQEDHEPQRKADEPIRVFLPGFLKDFLFLLGGNSGKAFFVAASPQSFGLLLSSLFRLPVEKIFFSFNGRRLFFLFSRRLFPAVRLGNSATSLPLPTERDLLQRFPEWQRIAILGKRFFPESHQGKLSKGILLSQSLSQERPELPDPRKTILRTKGDSPKKNLPKSRRNALPILLRKSHVRIDPFHGIRRKLSDTHPEKERAQGKKGTPFGRLLTAIELEGAVSPQGKGKELLLRFVPLPADHAEIEKKKGTILGTYPERPRTGITGNSIFFESLAQKGYRRRKQAVCLFPGKEPLKALEKLSQGTPLSMFPYPPDTPSEIKIIPYLNNRRVFLEGDENFRLSAEEFPPLLKGIGSGGRNGKNELSFGNSAHQALRMVLFENAPLGTERIPPHISDEKRAAPERIS
jgi:hypothetical protein